MKAKGIFLLLLRVAGVLSIGATSAALAQSVPDPSVSWIGANDYVVSYPACAPCFGDGIEEYQQATGSWQYVGSGPQTFENRAEGTYLYRVVYALEVDPTMIQLAYSGELAVVVSGAAQEANNEIPSLGVQFESDYEVLSGFMGGDALRDLLIRRVQSDPTWGPGPINAVLLRQDSSGSFEASIPSPYELAVAESWSPAAIELRKRDVNVDGFVDLVMRGVGRSEGFVGVANQILFAPGASASGQPSVRPADGRLERFSQDMNRHLVDPDYFPDNAPYNYALIVYYALDCGWQDYYGWQNDYGYWDYYIPEFCYYEPQIYLVVYQDYSVFDQDAVAIASKDYGIIHGYEPADEGMRSIATTIESLLDIRIGQGEIGSLLGSEQTQIAAEVLRGIELFSALAGISEAVAQEPDSGAVQPPSVERVQIKGRRVLGQGPFHTALEFRRSTISAYDSDPRPLIDGLLVSEVDWPRDHPSLTLRLGYVDGPGGPITYWQSLLAADGRYGDDLRYDLFPSLGEGGYNSNSYVTGLIQATAGLPTVQMTSFVGGERPVPVSEFN